MPRYQALPYADPVGIFIDEHNQRQRRPHGVTPDRRAIFSVLQFGAIIPPLTAWEEARRLLPGHCYEGNEWRGARQVLRGDPLAGLTPEEQTDEVVRRLDRILEGLLAGQPDPVVLFSGGTDSSLIAARLAALGRSETWLVNFSFGASDGESRNAEAIAQTLGLRFMRLEATLPLNACLEKPGQEYVQPFADRASGPMYDFARQVIERMGGRRRTILDGAGADSALGMAHKLRDWQRVWRLPPAGLQLLSKVYEQAAWARPGWLEFASRLAWRAVHLPRLAAALARNPLAGKCYAAEAAGEVQARLEDWIGGWAGTELNRQIAGAELALQCANINCQKAQLQFEQAGLAVAYPYMTDELIEFGLAVQPALQTQPPKAVLKRALTRVLPAELVYRPKSSGFLDPAMPALYEADFGKYLAAACDPAGPVGGVLNAKAVRQVLDLLRRKQPLPVQLQNFTWAAVFCDRWYRTANIN